MKPTITRVYVDLSLPPSPQAEAAQPCGDSTARLPVVYTFRGQKTLIRGTSDRLLAWMILRFASGGTFERVFVTLNTRAHITALVREARTRAFVQSNRKLTALLNRLDPPPCACGGPGLHIVGSTTYCRRCVGRARSRLAAMHRRQAPGKAEQYDSYQARLARRDRLPGARHGHGFK